MGVTNHPEVPRREEHPKVWDLQHSKWANQGSWSPPVGRRDARAHLKRKGAKSPGRPWTSGGWELVGDYSPSWCPGQMILRCPLHASRGS